VSSKSLQQTTGQSAPATHTDADGSESGQQNHDLLMPSPSEQADIAVTQEGAASPADTHHARTTRTSLARACHLCFGFLTDPGEAAADRRAIRSRADSMPIPTIDRSVQLWRYKLKGRNSQAVWASAQWLGDKAVEAEAQFVEQAKAQTA
jgi:hypothetical protein